MWSAKVHLLHLVIPTIDCVAQYNNLILALLWYHLQEQVNGGFVTDF